MGFAALNPSYELQMIVFERKSAAAAPPHAAFGGKVAISAA